MAPVDVPDAYNEEAFRYFLDIERRRSEMRQRPFVLLLLDLKTPPAPSDAPELSERLLWALSQFVRETDFIGWYREGSIAGAVLTQHAETAGVEVADAVKRRITRVLDERLPPDVASRVRVRVYQLPGADHHE